jgi:hypothetical protein
MAKESSVLSGGYLIVRGCARRLPWLLLMAVFIVGTYHLWDFYQSFNAMKKKTYQLSQQLDELITENKAKAVILPHQVSNFNRLSWVALTSGVELMSQDKLEQLKHWTDYHQVPCRQKMLGYLDAQLSHKHSLERASQKFNRVENIVQSIHVTQLASRSEKTVDVSTSKFLPSGWVSAFKPYLRVSKRKPGEQEVWLNSTDLVALKLMLSLQFMEARQFWFAGKHQKFLTSLEQTGNIITQYLGQGATASKLQNIIHQLLSISKSEHGHSSKDLLSCLVEQES